MKLCKDCKFYVRDWMSPFSGNFAKCSRKDVIRPNLITGRGTHPNDSIGENLNYCSLERKYDELCGESAVYFVSKK